MKEDAVSWPAVVYAVTSGSYSDYRIVAVFEREKDAQAAVGRGMGEDVEEFRFYREGEEPQRVMVHHGQARATRGRLPGATDMRVWAEPEWWTVGPNPAPRRPRVEVYAISNRAGDPRPFAKNISVTGASAQHVEKALRDRIAQIYAEWEGVA